MAETAFELAVLIETIDKFSSPMKGIMSTMATAEGRMQNMKAAMKNMGSSAAEIDKVTASLKKLDNMKQFDALATDLDKIGMSKEDIAAVSSSFIDMANQADKMEKLGNTMEKFQKTALVGAGMTVAGVGIAAGLVEATKQAGEFQTQLVTIQDVTGATNKQIQQLGDSIMNTSTQVTKFNDMDLTGFAKQLATGGFNNVADVRKLLLPVSQFAEAQSYEGKASSPQEAVNQAIQMAHMFKQYSPKQFSSFLNDFNKYSNMQPGNSSELYQTLTYLAPIASRQMKMSNPDVMALAAVANRVGLTGSHGGTNAADMILRLVPGLIGGKPQKGKAPPAAWAAMEQLGLVDSKGNSPFFKNGHITSLNDMLTTLIGASKRLTPEQMAQDYKAIFGIQGGRAASILSDPTTIEQLKKMQSQLHQTKSMQQIQEDINKTPEGQLNMLKSNSMTAELRFAQALGPMMNPILVNLNTMLSRFLKLEEQHPKLMKLVGVFTLMTAGLLLIAGPLTSLIGLFGMLGTGIRMAFASRGAIALGRNIKGMLSDMKVMALLSKEQAIGGAKSFMGGVKSVGGKIATGAQWVGSKSASAVKSMAVAMANLSKSALQASVAFAKTGAIWVANTAKMVAMKAVQLAIMAATKTWTAITIAFDAVMDANPIAIIILAIIALIAAVVLMITHWRQVITVVKEVWNWMKKFASDIGTTFSNLWKEAVSWGANIVKGLWQGISNFGGWLKTQIGNFVSQHITGPFKHLLGIHSPSTVFMEHGKYIVQGLALGIQNNSRLATTAVSGLARGTSSAAQTAMVNRSAQNSGGVIINVYPHKNQRAEDIASYVMQKMGRPTQRAALRTGARLNPSAR